MASTSNLTQEARERGLQRSLEVRRERAAAKEAAKQAVLEDLYPKALRVLEKTLDMAIRDPKPPSTAANQVAVRVVDQRDGRATTRLEVRSDGSVEGMTLEQALTMIREAREQLATPRD